jgi:enediyne biosynthesis protein E4
MQNSIVLVLTVATVAAAASGCGPEDTASPPDASVGGSSSVAFSPRVQHSTPASQNLADSTRLVSVPKFSNVRDGSGIEHTYWNGASGDVLMVESLGAGACWLDMDHDGLLDCYLVQGERPESKDRSECLGNLLFRQSEGHRFHGVGRAAGVNDRSYGQGVSAADFDNDGFVDLYVTNVSANRMYRNQGDGTFEEIASQNGTDDGRWSSSAAWTDLDLDGDLDLYVCNYLKYDPFAPLLCEKDGESAMCHPRQLEPWPDECFENLGDGTFAPVSDKWGLKGDGSKALGVVVADFDNNGWPDIYVANDTTANFMFINQAESGPDGPRFIESAVRLGSALSGSGSFQASMGIAVGDIDNDQLIDIFLTHFTGESNTLYKNWGPAGFEDISSNVGIRKASLDRLGFGVLMHDFDQNGTPDLIVANGHIDERNADGAGYRQSLQLLTLAGDSWVDCSDKSGEVFLDKSVGRGVAGGDYDRDGDLDLLVVNQNSSTYLLRNDSVRGHWLKIGFVGVASNRNGVGCRVLVHAGDRVLMQELVGGASYCSSHEHVLVFGLGKHDSVVDIDVVWPGGTQQTLKEVTIDRSVVFVESTAGDSDGSVHFE